MDLELRHLRCVVALAEELNFRRAAGRLFITQPALSHQLQRIEEELGVRLFERSRRHVALTPAGRAFLPGARRALDNAERAARDARNAAGEGERIVLASLEAQHLAFRPVAVQAFLADHPGVELRYLDLVPAEHEAALLDGRADVALPFLPVHQRGLEVRPAIEGRWLAILQESHPLAGQPAIRTPDLRDTPLIVPARSLNAPVHDALLGELRAGGVEPIVAHEIGQTASAAPLAAAGLGVVLLPAYVPVNLPVGVVTRPVDGLTPLRIGVAWRRRNASRL